MKKIILSLLLSCCCQFLGAQVPLEVVNDVLSQNIVVDLREPVYSDGVLSTTEGGVVTGPDMRVQAQNITYTQRTVDGQRILQLEASGDLMAEYHGWLFVGDSLEYDFVAGEGYIHQGRTAIEGWYFGGAEIHLRADGTHAIHDGFATTSEDIESDWQIVSPRITITDNRLLDARNIQFRFIKLPILWFPSYKVNLQTSWRAPLKYRARWSGRLGPRLGLTYPFLSVGNFTASALIDYSLKRGIGGGLEAEYQQSNGPRQFNGLAYFVNDRSPYEAERNRRYRVWGTYYDHWCNPDLSLWLSYDQLSDRFMASDYDQQSIHFHTIQPTKLAIRKQDDFWIGNLIVHPRVNQFQTIKQELPTFNITLHPYDVFCSGIIGDTTVDVSFLDFRYDKDLQGVSDFQSGRIEARQLLYRPLFLGPLLLTPEAGIHAIHYTDSPLREPVTQIVTLLGTRAETRLSRSCVNWSHTISPYAHLKSFEASKDPVFDHYLFDIADGWTDLHLIRTGATNSIYWCCNGEIRKVLFNDTYTYGFIEDSSFPRSVPRIYSTTTWQPTPYQVYRMTGAWDRIRSQIDHLNISAEITFNKSLALSTEYRRRSSFSWRKLDYDNFFLDAFTTESNLRNSRVSDRRESLLTHLYWRVSPWWAIEVQSNAGWGRILQPTYHEYQVDLHTWLRGSWQARFSYQNKENDSRVAVYLTLGRHKPKPYCDGDPRLMYGNY